MPMLLCHVLTVNMNSQGHIESNRKIGNRNFEIEIISNRKILDRNRIGIGIWIGIGILYILHDIVYNIICIYTYYHIIVHYVSYNLSLCIYSYMLCIIYDISYTIYYIIYIYIYILIYYILTYIYNIKSYNVM